MKRALFAIIWISVSCFSCVEEPEFCYDCTKTRMVIQTGHTDREETVTEYCGKTAEEADRIEKAGTHTENLGGTSIMTTTVCRHK